MSTSMVTLYQLMLRLADEAPDELLYTARSWLAAGLPVEAAQSIAFAAHADWVSLGKDDIDVLRVMLQGTATHPDLLDALTPVEHRTTPAWYGFAPVDPRSLAEYGDAVPYTLDLAEGVAAGSVPLDGTDAAAVAAVAGPGTPIGLPVGDVAARALWRSWRYPVIPAPWPLPKRVYLLLAVTDDEASLPVLGDLVQQALVAAGEADPRVEVFTDADALPPFHRTALGLATLLWTDRPESPVQIASLFDTFDEAGGLGFAAEHPALDPEERDAVLAYLDRGAPLLSTTIAMQDVVQPENGDVSMSFRTDGYFIWTEATAYYLARYGLAPDDALLQHIRAHQYQMSDVDDVALHRAMSAFQVPVGEDCQA